MGEWVNVRLRLCPSKSLLPGCPPELHGKTLLPKVIGHGEVKLVLTQSRLPDSRFSEYQMVSWTMLGRISSTVNCTMVV